LDGEVQGFGCVKKCRVKERQRAILRLDQRRYLGAPEHDALRSFTSKPPDDSKKEPPGIGADLAAAQLLVNDVIHPVLVRRFGDQYFDSGLSQSLPEKPARAS
jgi:hypothetical protein